MKRLSLYLIGVFTLTVSMVAIPVYARERAQGYCEQGGHTVVTQGLQSTNDMQQSFPSCTVTVYDAGTTTLSTIYADNSGTAKGNPFTSDANGYWYFYANNGRYDVHFSNSVIGTPYTQGDYLLCDPADATGSFSCTGGGASSCPLGPTDTRYVDSAAGSDLNIGRNWCSAYATEGAAVTALTATGGWIYVAPDYTGAVPASVPSNIHILQTNQFDAHGTSVRRFAFEDWADTTEDHFDFFQGSSSTPSDVTAALTALGPFGQTTSLASITGSVNVPATATNYGQDQSGVLGVFTGRAANTSVLQGNGVKGVCYDLVNAQDCTGVTAVSGTGAAVTTSGSTIEGMWSNLSLITTPSGAMGLVIRATGGHMPTTEFGAASGRPNSAIDVNYGGAAGDNFPAGIYFETNAVSNWPIVFAGNSSQNTPHTNVTTFNRWKDYYSASTPYDSLSVINGNNNPLTSQGTYQVGNYIFQNSANSSEVVLPINHTGTVKVEGVNAVTFSATPVFDRAQGSVQTITLTANVTSSTLNNCVAGQTVIFDIIENGTGGFTFAWPATFHGAGAITTTASEHNRQMFYCDGTNVWSVSAMQSGT